MSGKIASPPFSVRVLCQRVYYAEHHDYHDTPERGVFWNSQLGGRSHQFTDPLGCFLYLLRNSGYLPCRAYVDAAGVIHCMGDRLADPLCNSSGTVAGQFDIFRGLYMQHIHRDMDRDVLSAVWGIPSV